LDDARMACNDCSAERLCLLSPSRGCYIDLVVIRRLHYSKHTHTHTRTHAH